MSQHHAQHPADRHPITSYHWEWAMPLMAAWLGVLVGAGVLLTIQAHWQANEAWQSQHRPYARISQPTQAVQTNLYRIRVMSAVQTIENDPAFTPGPGLNLAMFSLSVENTGATTQSFMPSVQTYLRDDEGNTYPMHPASAITTPLPATELATGQTVSGQVSYALPATVKHFRLYVDPVWQNMAPVVFDMRR